MADSTTTRKLCGAMNRRGVPCGMTAGQGTDHEGFGNCKHHCGSTESGKKKAAREAAAYFAEPEGLDPHVALEKAVATANGLLNFFRDRVHDLDDTALVSGETLNVWLREFQQQPFELARVAKYAVDAGVAERHVRAIEQWSGPLAQLLEAVLRDRELGLTDVQLRKAPKVVGRHLRALEAPAADRVAA